METLNPVFYKKKSSGDSFGIKLLKEYQTRCCKLENHELQEDQYTRTKEKEQKRKADKEDKQVSKWKEKMLLYKCVVIAESLLSDLVTDISLYFSRTCSPSSKCEAWQAELHQLQFYSCCLNINKTDMVTAIALPSLTDLFKRRLTSNYICYCSILHNSKLYSIYCMSICTRLICTCLFSQIHLWFFLWLIKFQIHYCLMRHNLTSLS